jgi:hypothetical protein
MPRAPVYVVTSIACPFGIAIAPDLVGTGFFLTGSRPPYLFNNMDDRTCLLCAGAVKVGKINLLERGYDNA